MAVNKQKCCFAHCQNEGEPQEGFDFFVCEQCFKDFDLFLEREWAEKEKPLSTKN